MFSIDINGKTVEAELNFGSAVDYELEFGRDMVADVNGSIREGDTEFITFAEDGETLVGIDFSAVPWTTLLKVLWISVKTVNPKTKPFRKWAAETKGINMLVARALITEEMESCFFRDAPVEQDDDQGE